MPYNYFMMFVHYVPLEIDNEMAKFKLDVMGSCIDQLMAEQ